MAAARGNGIVLLVPAGEEDVVTQREPRHHLMVGITSLTQMAKMRRDGGWSPSFLGYISKLWRNVKGGEKRKKETEEKTNERDGKKTVGKKEKREHRHREKRRNKGEEKQKREGYEREFKYREKRGAEKSRKQGANIRFSRERSIKSV